MTCLAGPCWKPILAYLLLPPRLVLPPRPLCYLLGPLTLPSTLPVLLYPAWWCRQLGASQLSHLTIPVPHYFLLCRGQCEVSCKSMQAKLSP